MRGFGQSGIVEKIRASGGEIVAVTSEPQSLASGAQDAWGLDFECVGDPHHEILDEVRDRGWLDVFINRDGGDLQGGLVEGISHLKGFFQPGTLAVQQDGRVLYRWRSVPTRKNLGGAIDRPTPDHIWSQISSRLDGDESQAPHDDDPGTEGARAPWPLFILGALANGWFIKPKGFAIDQAGDGEDPPVRKMGLRVLGFFGLWGVAFTALPWKWVAGLLAGYVAAIAPSVNAVNREFQNVEPVGQRRR